MPEENKTPQLSLAELEAKAEEKLKNNPDDNKDDKDQKELEAKKLEEEKNKEEQEKREKEEREKLDNEEKEKLKLEEEKRKSKIDNPDSDDDSNDDKNKSFWDDVEKLSGEKVEVDFGDIDPETPEGAYKYAQAFRDKGIEEFEALLEKKAPKAYKALQMEMEGIDPSSLFKEQPETDYTKVILDEKNIDQLKSMYIQSLKAKGNSDEDILELVKLAEDKGKLLERSKVGLEELRNNQILKDKEREEIFQKEIEAKNQLIDGMVSKIEDTVKKGEIGKFLIPEKDRPELAKRFVNNLRIIEGKFYFVKPINDKELDNELQAEFFKMKGGNLSDLVKREATTQNVKKLKRKIEESEDKNKSQEGSGKSKKLSLKDMTEQ